MGIGRSILVVPFLAAPVLSEEPMDDYLILAKMIRITLAQVTWAGKPTEEPLRLAVIGGVPFGLKLDQALKQGTIGGRTATISYLNLTTFLEDPRNYDVLFIDRGAVGEERLGPLLTRTQGRSILTIGYEEGLARRGVMMNFYLEGNHMHFEINPTRIKQARLTLSSYLMNMSKIVEPR